jgi:tripartite-type tricarboxylate transporter receptor subunit TctC
MELLKSRVAGFKPEHVPYQGNPQVITAMLGDQVQMGLIPPGVAMPQIKAGKLKAIGLSGGRSALVPEVPPLSDAGVRDFTLEVWVALLGPANLSKAAQTRIASALEVVMKDPDVRRKLFEQGWQAVGTSPDGMRTRVSEEAAIMTRIISTRGIKLQ